MGLNLGVIRIAGFAAQTDLLLGDNPVSRGDKKTAHMGIASHKAVRMTKLHIPAIPSVDAGKAHATAFRSQNRVSDTAQEIYSFMGALPFVSASRSKIALAMGIISYHGAVRIESDRAAVKRLIPKKLLDLVSLDPRQGGKASQANKKKTGAEQRTRLSNSLKVKSSPKHADGQNAENHA